MSHKLLNPQNKHEQIQGVIEFYLTPLGISHIGGIPECISKVALIMFISEGECSGYRAMVIRNALQELVTKGLIDYTTGIYMTE